MIEDEQRGDDTGAAGGSAGAGAGVTIRLVKEDTGEEVHSAGSGE